MIRTFAKPAQATPRASAAIAGTHAPATERIALKHDFSSIEIEAQSDAGTRAPRNPTIFGRPRSGPPRPPMTGLTFNACPDHALIADAVAAMRRWVSDVAPRVASYAGRLSGTMAADAGAPPADHAIIAQAFQTNFHTTAPADVQSVSRRLGVLHLIASSPISFTCIGACNPNELAAVARGAAGTVPNEVYICQGFFTCTNEWKRRGIVLHERVHRVFSARDHAYEFDRGYATLSPALAMDNADSYAVFIRQVFANGAHGPVEHC